MVMTARDNIEHVPDYWLPLPSTRFGGEGTIAMPKPRQIDEAGTNLAQGPATKIPAQGAKR